MIPNHDRLLCEVNGEQAHDVTLTGLVNENHAEARNARVKILGNARKRHDPHRYCISSTSQGASGFNAQSRHTLSRAASNLSDDVLPSLKGLAFLQSHTFTLSRP